MPMVNPSPMVRVRVRVRVVCWYSAHLGGRHLSSARPRLTKCRARVRVRVNCGATWSSYPWSRETKRASLDAGARVPPRPPCRRRPALGHRPRTTPRSEMAAPASTECRHPEASVEAIGGSAGAAAEHMHAATAGFVAAATQAEPPAEISKLQDWEGAQPSNPAEAFRKNPEHEELEDSLSARPTAAKSHHSIIDRYDTHWDFGTDERAECQS
eukprot:scaffold18825_cov80-Phaeocystis_antarctica.AAC.1